MASAWNRGMVFNVCLIASCNGNAGARQNVSQRCGPALVARHRMPRRSASNDARRPQDGFVVNASQRSMGATCTVCLNTSARYTGNYEHTVLRVISSSRPFLAPWFVTLICFSSGSIPILILQTTTPGALPAPLLLWEIDNDDVTRNSLPCWPRGCRTTRAGGSLSGLPSWRRARKK